MMSEKTKQLLAAGVVSALLSTPASQAAPNSNANMSDMMGSDSPIHLVSKDKLERCFGINKRGRNDCGTATHACANQAVRDNDPQEWIFVLKGTCKKITGASLQAVARESSYSKPLGANQQLGVSQSENESSNTNDGNEVLY